MHRTVKFTGMQKSVGSLYCISKCVVQTEASVLSKQHTVLSLASLSHWVVTWQRDDRQSKWQSLAKADRTSAIQLQYNCNTKNFFLYCSCIALVRTPAIQRCNTSFLQLAENLHATCSSCKKTCIAVVLHLCGPFKSGRTWSNSWKAGWLIKSWNYRQQSYVMESGTEYEYKA